jgi:hypothetical protein
MMDLREAKAELERSKKEALDSLEFINFLISSLDKLIRQEEVVPVPKPVPELNEYQKMALDSIVKAPDGADREAAIRRAVMSGLLPYELIKEALGRE